MKTDPILVVPPAEKAVFIDRPNRFLVRARLGNATVRASMPNPGRMGELLLPGVEVYLSDIGRRGGRKTRYQAMAVRRGDSIRLLDTHRNNAVAEELIRRGAIPSLRDARVVRREVKHGRSRFDLLLDIDGDSMFLEVKSCSLIERGVALFPDAPTERGRRHVEELARITGEGGRAGVLFVVHDFEAIAFLPHIHTDLPFARTLFETARRFPGAAACGNGRFRMIAAAIRMNEDLSVDGRVRELPIPMERLEGELEDRGSYLVFLRLPRKRRIEVGALGDVLFPVGFYAYAGSAEKNLQARIERHRRRRKRFHWHIDYLRDAAEWEEAFPFRSSKREECDVAGAVSKIADSEVARFGSSDCACRSHLFYFKKDPRATRRFQDLLAHFRNRV